MSPDPQAQIAKLQRELELALERENLLSQIDAVARAASQPAEITGTAARLLGSYLQVERCIYAEVGPDQDSVSIIGNYVNGLPSLEGAVSLGEFPVTARELLASGESFIVIDTEADPRCTRVPGAARTAGTRSKISSPLMRDGRLCALFAVHCTRPREWQPHEIALVKAVAARCWESVERQRVLRAMEADREELRRKTEELERQHAELQTIYDTAPIGLAYFDLDDYHYLRLNERQAAFFGLKPAQVLGKTLIEMAPIPGLRELFDQVARGEPVINFPLEGTLVTDPNEYRYWTVSYFPVYGPDGVIQGITAASQEITQQKKAEIALLQNEKLAAVGRLAASIAHEINNPLEAVTNLLYLARCSETMEGMLELLEMADVELRRVAAITAQTLRFHRQSTSPQEVDTAAMVRDMLNLYAGRLRNVRMVPATRLRAQRPVRCFDGEIRQVFANLMTNALDAMAPEAGRLFIRTREGTRWSDGQRGVVLTIADVGSGIAPETARRLFEPFFTTKGTTGTGLGLWVSKEIISRHRGTIRLRSSCRPAHHGTVFTVFLPFEAVERA